MRIETMRRTETERGKVRLVKTDSTTDPFAVFVEMPGEPVKLKRYRNFHEAVAGYSCNAGIVKPLESPHPTTEVAQ